MTAEGERRPNRSHRIVRPQIQAVYQRVIDTRGVPPVYDDVAKDFGVGKETVYQAVRTGGMLPALRDLRRQLQAEVEIFPHTSEVAWFMGMLTGTSGHIDYNPPSLYFTNKSRSLRDAFRQSGENIIHATNPRAKANEGVYRNNVNPSVVFRSKMHVEAIGKFRIREKAKTIYEKFDWLLTDPFLVHYASGIFDSAGHINDYDGVRMISFRSTNPPLAELYRDVLTRLGMENADLIKLYGAYRIQSPVQGARIRAPQDLALYAQTVTSADRERQKQLDELKSTKRRTRRVHAVKSAAEVLEEWRRIGGNLSSNKLLALRYDGGTWLHPGVIKKLFGQKPYGGPASYPVGRRALDALIAAEPADVEEALKTVKVEQKPKKREYRRRFTNAELITEYHRVKAEECQGVMPTLPELKQLYKEGKTSVDPQHYVVHMGDNGFGRSFFVAQSRLEGADPGGQTSEHVYP